MTKLTLPASLALLLALVSALPSGANDVGFTITRHPVSGAKYPQLTRGGTRATRETINRALAEQAAGYRCGDDEEIPKGQDLFFKVRSRVTLARNDVLSVSIETSYNCGGPYPDEGNDSVTHDLRTGERVPFEDLFQDWNRDAEAIVRAIFPRKIAAAERARGVPPSEEPTCEQIGFFLVPDVLANGFSYYLEGEDVHVQPNAPHVTRACAEEVAVPVKTLLRFARPDGILIRVVHRE